MCIRDRVCHHSRRLHQGGYSQFDVMSDAELGVHAARRAAVRRRIRAVQCSALRYPRPYDSVCPTRRSATGTTVSGGRIFRRPFLLWDGTSTGWVVVTSGASLPLARAAWLGFVCRGELPETLDLFLQLDHLEFTPNNQPLELL